MRDLTYSALQDNFPFDRPRNTQSQALESIAGAKSGVILEIPTGEGKTAIGLASLLTLSRKGKGPGFYITPTKNLVNQVQQMIPREAIAMYGRSEYSCTYYRERGTEMSADQSPCYMLRCSHRVNQDTGETMEPGVEPCPYFRAKYEARVKAENGGIVVCTTAFFLMNRLLVPPWKDMEPSLVVIDEAHRLAETARSIFEQTVTDLYLGRSADLIAEVDKVQAEKIRDFAGELAVIASAYTSSDAELLSESELGRLIDWLRRINTVKLEDKIRQAIASGRIDPIGQQKELKALEQVVKGIPRLLNSLGYSLYRDDRPPLNYVIAYHKRGEERVEVEGKAQRASVEMTIRAYYVKTIIRRAVGENAIAYSATIGDREVFAWESGLDFPLFRFGSSFSSDKSLIILPKDGKDLSYQKQGRDDLKNAIKSILAAARKFAAKGHRSLIVVVSEEERQKVLWFADRDGPKAVSYNGVRNPRQSAAAFLAGEGDVLVGTAAQYSTGLDLPAGVAPVIFFLRPGYQQPNDPKSQFEKRRFSDGQFWALQQHRVLVEALQVRGRNIRSVRDKGICFFVSRQFQRFLFAGLPEALKSSYRSNLTFEQGVEQSLMLLEG